MISTAVVAFGVLWVPVAGLIWLGRRNENLRAQRLLREATSRAQLRHIAGGRK